MTPPFTLKLPLPPSANTLFRNVRGVGRVKTKVYHEWLKAAEADLWRQKPKGGYPAHARDFEIIVCIPANTRGDCDNRAKAAIDALVKWSLIADDRYAVATTVRRVLGLEPGICRVTVRPALPETVEAA